MFLNINNYFKKKLKSFVEALFNEGKEMLIIFLHSSH